MIGNVFEIGKKSIKILLKTILIDLSQLGTQFSKLIPNVHLDRIISPLGGTSFFHFSDFQLTLVLSYCCVGLFFPSSSPHPRTGHIGSQSAKCTVMNMKWLTIERYLMEGIEIKERLYILPLGERVISC